MDQSVDGPRLARPEEFREAIALAERCFGFDPGGLEGIMPHCFDENHPERHAVVKRDDEVVSHVVCVPAQLRAGEARVECGGIAGVATHPDHRGNGYMTRLIEFWLDRLDDRGVPLAELEGDRVRYGRFGWENAGRETVYRVTRRSFDGEPTADGPVRPYRGPADVPTIRNVHETERYRVGRDRERYERLLGQSGLETLVYDGDRPAYLCHDGEEPVTVEEFGGGRSGVAALLQRVLERSEEVEVYAHPRHSLVSLFRDVAADWEHRPHRKLNLLDVEGALESYRPLLERRWSSICGGLGGRSGTVSVGVSNGDGRTESSSAALIRYGDDGRVSIERTDGEPDVEMDRRRLTRLLFGTADDYHSVKRERPFLSAVLPLEYYFWQTETI